MYPLMSCFTHEAYVSMAFQRWWTFRCRLQAHLYVCVKCHLFVRFMEERSCIAQDSPPSVNATLHPLHLDRHMGGSA
jgi:hypothetical protein